MDRRVASLLPSELRCSFCEILQGIQGKDLGMGRDVMRVELCGVDRRVASLLPSDPRVFSRGIQGWGGMRIQG